MDYQHLIEKRQSYREFINKEIKVGDIAEIKGFFTEAHKLEGADLTLRIFTGKETAMRLEGVAGYNGYAFLAPMYLVFLGKATEENYVSAGFTAMDVLLKVNDLGIDACFLTVDESTMVKKVLQIDGDKEVLSVIACGYAKKVKKTLRIDIISPSDVKMTEREGYFAPKISMDNMVYGTQWNHPLELGTDFTDPALDEAFQAARLAPYFFNRQQYKYFIKDNKVVLLNKEDEMVSKEDSLIGLGCTMFNFYIMYTLKDRKTDGWKFEKVEGLGEPAEYKQIASITI